MMGIEDVMISRRQSASSRGVAVLPDNYNGVTKQKISNVLSRIDRSTDNMVDAVFALLCDEDNWKPAWAKNGFKFRDGATTSHIGTHIGILQRGRNIKLDREGRDYWLKPLWEIGAIEKVYFDPIRKVYVEGHPKAKSPNSAYRLAPEFIRILECPDSQIDQLINEWIKKEIMVERLALQAEAAKKTTNIIFSEHSQLIQDSCEIYVPRFLPDYQIVYVDDGDGDRITEEQLKILNDAGLSLTLHDSMPDVLLINPSTNHLWVIEAVTSDGEVDIHKKQSLEGFACRNNKTGVGFTTTYPTWKKAAERQSLLKNLADKSYLWIREDPSRNILIQQ